MNYTITYTWIPRFGSGGRQYGSIVVWAESYELALNYVKAVVGSTFRLPFDTTNRVRGY